MIKLQYRNIFEVKKISITSKIYRYFYDNKSLAKPKVFLGPAKFFIKCLFKIFKQEGTAVIKLINECLPFNVNLKNTQYHAIYFDKFKNGYEPDVLSLIDLLLPTNGIFYDIGSNWGIFSIYALCLSENNRTVYSFDAQKEVLDDLINLKKEHIDIFRNLNIINLTLGSKDNEIISFESLDQFHSGLFRRSLSRCCVQLETKKLDNLDIKKPDLIKIDIEGMESDVILGARNLISTSKPYIIVENPTTDYSKKVLTKISKSLGYKLFGLYVVSSDGKMCMLKLNRYTSSSIEKNILCIPSEKYHEFNDLISDFSLEID